MLEGSGTIVSSATNHGLFVMSFTKLCWTLQANEHSQEWLSPWTGTPNIVVVVRDDVDVVIVSADGSFQTLIGWLVPLWFVISLVLGSPGSTLVRTRELPFEREF